MNLFNGDASSHPSCFFAHRAQARPWLHVCLHYPPGILFLQITCTHWCVFECDDYQVNRPLLTFETALLLHNQTAAEGSPLTNSLRSLSHILFLHCAFCWLMVYCDVNVHFVSHNFPLYLNKLCAHGEMYAGHSRGCSTLSSSGFDRCVFESENMLGRRQH